MNDINNNKHNSKYQAVTFFRLSILNIFLSLKKGATIRYNSSDITYLYNLEALSSFSFGIF